MAEARGLRIVSVAILVFILGIVGTLVSVVLIIRDPLPVVRLGTSASFALPDEPRSIIVRLNVDAGGGFVLIYEGNMADIGGADPQIAFNMPHNDQFTIEPLVEEVGHLRYQAEGRLGIPGRWRLRIDHGQTSHVFDFVLTAF